MGRPGEFTAHPAELGGVLERFLLGLSDVDLLQHPMIVGARRKAGLNRHLVIDLPSGRLAC